MEQGIHVGGKRNEGSSISPSHTISSSSDESLQLRWPFLAKSHVPQRVVINSKYSFQCLFCVYLGWSEASTVYTRMELYLDHISKEHRSKPLGDVIEYKTRCVSNRVADDKELFDINLWPQTDHEARESSRWLSDDLLRQPGSISTLPNVKLEVQGNIRIPPDNLYDHHASTGLQDVLTAKEYLAEILETPALKNQANGGPTPQSESYPEGHGSTTTSSAPPAHAIALSTHSIPPHALLTPARQMQSKDSIEGQGASNDLRTGINVRWHSVYYHGQFTDCLPPRAASTQSCTFSEKPAP